MSVAVRSVGQNIKSCACLSVRRPSDVCVQDCYVSCDLPRSHPVLRSSHFVQRWCAYLHWIEYKIMCTVPASTILPPLPWWALDLSGVASRRHRPRTAPAANTFWPMVGWEFLPVKVLGRALLHLEDFLGVKFGCWVRVFHVASLHTVLIRNQLCAWW